MLNITINGKSVSYPVGTTVAAAVLSEGIISFRASVTGKPRTPLCGMGICYECRLDIDGIQNEKSCQIEIREGMTIKTDEND